MGDSSPAGDGLREGTREEQRAGKAPYRVIRTGPPTNQYANRPLPGDATEIDHHWPSISTGISRGREKEEEGETWFPRALLFPTVCLVRTARYRVPYYTEMNLVCRRRKSTINGGNRPSTAEVDRRRPILAVPPSSGWSTYRSTVGPVCTGRYGSYRSVRKTLPLSAQTDTTPVCTDVLSPIYVLYKVHYPVTLVCVPRDCWTNKYRHYLPNHTVMGGIANLGTIP
ncbi:hypothetical protein GW17_00034325 [Ensete ventricosum]|nr:hypothetical protein GW17_00034325 [Ensete ventricosum]